jgi:hypothetical protein
MSTPILPVRVPAEQRQAWRAAAEREGMDLSAWIRRVCDLAAMPPACEHLRKGRGQSGLVVCLDCGRPS